MVVCEKKLANVMGGKSARACDNCISKRATWYCPADDAFLCQSCDSSVHSANPLARRHQRVRLKTASMKHLRKLSVPSWHRGFTKKARTPRNKKHAKLMFEEASESSSSGVNVINHLDLVPELCSDGNSFEENDEQLLYRVPIFDPFVQELCNDSNSNEGVTTNTSSPQIELKGTQSYSNQLHGSLPSEMELEEFAADVESLLGKRLDDESCDIEGLGFSDCKDRRDDQIENSCGSGQVKVEDGGEIGDHGIDDDHVDGEIREPFEISFDFDSSMACEEDYNKVQLGHDLNRDICKVEEGSISGKKILLRLDYEGVMTSWADQKSPWTTGERPELDPYGCWPVCTGSCGRVHPYGDVGMYGQPAIVDGGREARVSRYREKRRTRLFSKKIRYEVRKLNAEKRPRMKGRFVKRANLPSFPSNNK